MACWLNIYMCVCGVAHARVCVCAFVHLVCVCVCVHLSVECLLFVDLAFAICLKIG